MIVLYFIAWMFLTLLALFVLILLIPVHYDLSGYWQEKFSGIVKIGIGPLQGLVKWVADGNNIFALQMMGITLLKKPLSKNSEKREKEKEKEPTFKQENSTNRRDVFDFLEKDLIKSLFRVGRDILRHCSPRVMELEGVWGFSDPYYTGILAALKAVIPGIHVEPEFTEEVRDLKVLVQGRIRPSTLLFYGLRFIISSAARPVLKKLWQKRKRNNKNNATTRGSAVY